ncbi:IS21-like element helper ATPase IstB [Algoriphagus aquimarinus]|uniref:IS21-like element helper ATPase IstB n=1 Tax=Algoriphagus aquimarinus TaxID=237018 RepID=UPI0030D8D901|tara:strand:+ start:133 stop:873 length:741 start_codon:yes stop_codon:yes gene_type:complete
MNNNQTIEKLKTMRLGAMAQLHLQHVNDNRLGGMTCDEYLAVLTDHQWEERENKKVDRLLKQASFRQNANLANIDYSPERNLDKNMFARLCTLDFISRREGLIICGASGVGKSYLVQALGHQACLSGYKTFYTVTARLFKRLKLSKVDGTYLKELEKLVKVDLLILDDFGLQAFDNQDRETLMDIIDDRHGQKSTLISSQIPVSAWYEVIGGEGTLADALLDRIVNSSHRIDLKGKSLRNGILKKE